MIFVVMLSEIIEVVLLARISDKIKRGKAELILAGSLDSGSAK
jgi:hypothetical protein